MYRYDIIPVQYLSFLDVLSPTNIDINSNGCILLYSSYTSGKFFAVTEPVTTLFWSDVDVENGNIRYKQVRADKFAV